MTKPIKKDSKMKFKVDDIVSCAGQKNWGRIASIDDTGLYVLFGINKVDPYLGTFSYNELVAMSRATNFNIPEAHCREYKKGMSVSSDYDVAEIIRLEAKLKVANGALDLAQGEVATLDEARRKASLDFINIRNENDALRLRLRKIEKILELFLSDQIS